MSDQNEENILYGGPAPESIDVNFKSLGELLLKKLSIDGDDLIYVSKRYLFKQNRIFEQFIPFEL